MAYFFQANRQRYTQWNPHRRGTRGVIPQCVLHTFEWPPERTILSAATFLLTRTTPGSYHTIAGGSSERDVLRLAPVTAETWHCVPSNNWAIGISATTYASRWGSLGSRTRRNFIHSMAYAAYLASLELIAAGKSPIPAKSISRAEAMAGVWGFTYHRTMDPGRRTDPANPASTFPWAEFLAEYERLMGGTAAAPTPTGPSARPDVEVQFALAVLGHYDPGPDLRYLDGINGASQQAAVTVYQRRAGLLADGWWGTDTDNYFERTDMADVIRQIWEFQNRDGTPSVWNLLDQAATRPATVAEVRDSDSLHAGKTHEAVQRDIQRLVVPQLGNLVGAVAALAGGEAFDQGKLLAGVQESAEEGARAGALSAEATMREALIEALAEQPDRDAAAVADAVVTKIANRLQGN